MAWLAALAFGVAVLAAPVPATNAVHLLRAEIDGQALDYRISIERARSLPRWSPADGKAPPLRGDQAIRVATEWMKARNPRFDTFLPWRIELTRATYINGGVLWHYVVSSDAVVGTRRIPGFGMQAIVLLDGSVVEPEGD